MPVKAEVTVFDLPPIYVPVVMRVDRSTDCVCCGRRREPEPGATHARDIG